jgi:outer membrane protein
VKLRAGLPLVARHKNSYMTSGEIPPQHHVYGAPMHASHLLPGLLLAALLLSGCTTSDSSSGVAVVDSARVFKESEPGKAGIKHLEALHEAMQAELDALQEELQGKPKDEKLQQRLQEKYMVYQQRMSAEQQQVINTLNETIQKALDACRVQHNLALVVGTDVVLSYGQTANITEAVISEVNKAQVDFKALDPEAEVATPAPATPRTAPSPGAPKSPLRK